MDPALPEALEDLEGLDSLEDPEDLEVPMLLGPLIPLACFARRMVPVRLAIRPLLADLEAPLRSMKKAGLLLLDRRLEQA